MLKASSRVGVGIATFLQQNSHGPSSILKTQHHHHQKAQCVSTTIRKYIHQYRHLNTTAHKTLQTAAATAKLQSAAAATEVDQQLERQSTQSHWQDWMVNMDRECDSWLHGPRPDEWYTGKRPVYGECPGVLMDGITIIYHIVSYI